MSDDTTEPDVLRELRDALRAFAADRDWDQFHTPANLAIALAVEAGELLEHFQWMAGPQATAPDPAKLREIESEIADVLIYLVRLADKLEIDLRQAASTKMARNAEKYPAAKVRGSSRKYSDLD
jgi:dCTP diphosphatase